MNPLHIFPPLRPTLAAPVAWTTRRRNFGYASSRSKRLLLTRTALIIEKDMQWVHMEFFKT